MVVEAPASRAVEWTRPAELSLSPREAATLENAGPGHAGGMRYAVYADGRVTMFDSDSVPEP
jgi:hypothetical protein